MSTKAKPQIELTDQEAEGALVAYDQARRDEAEGREAKDKIGAHIRWYLEHRHPRIENEERGLVAYLQERTGAEEADLIRMAEKAPDLLLRLAWLGCLRLDAKALAVFQGKSDVPDRAKPYIMPGKSSRALIVAKK